MGAAGFEDVVASIEPLQPGAPPHWSVTFMVDSADEIANKATQLGGTVQVAPFDAPWVRMTVLSDPQGAAFIASQFVPENRDAQPTQESISAA
jgi:predicted enzyme related to lactoylglutathione lyase